MADKVVRARKKPIAPKEVKPLTKRFYYLIGGSFLAVFSFLLLVSLLETTDTILADFQNIVQYGFSFGDIVHLRFAYVSNPIGIFGALFSYLFLILFGKFQSFCISLFGIATGIILARKIKSTKIILKTINLFLLTVLLNFVLLVLDILPREPGMIPNFIVSFLMAVFKPTGTILLASVGIITALVLTMDLESIKNLFRKNETNLLPDNKIDKSIPKNEPTITNITTILEKPAVEPPKITSHITTAEEISPTNSETQPAETVKVNKPQKIKRREEYPNGELFGTYIKPDINVFLTTNKVLSKRDKDEIEAEIKGISTILQEKLAEFEVAASVKNVNIGPIITQYELEPAPGIKVSRFLSLADDLALAIKAKSIRVQAPIPGRGLIGIEIPNKTRDVIFLKDILLCEEMKKNESILTIGLGKDIAGNPVIADLTKMPHLLIAGATGSGKSVCVNTIINSILLRTTPDEVRLVLIDPKRIELSGYEGIPHLIQDVVTEPEDALLALNWAVYEMERRYELLQKYKVRDISNYNNKILDQQKEEPEDEVLPYIVVIVDEFADLIMTAGRDIELPITRLAQMARAIGIHLILATQRPSIKVITGIIKANFPARIAFQVSSKVDSRVILDTMGAERLLGRGDMLFLPPGKANPDRIHGAFLADSEIEAIVEYLKMQPKPKLRIEMIKQQDKNIEEFQYDDELFPEAARSVVQANVASVSMLQRQFKIGYARAGRLIDMLEQAGIIGPHLGSKSRDVIATEEDLKIYGYDK